MKRATWLCMTALAFGCAEDLGISETPTEPSRAPANLVGLDPSEPDSTATQLEGHDTQSLSDTGSPGVDGGPLQNGADASTGDAPEKLDAGPGLDGGPRATERAEDVHPRLCGWQMQLQRRREEHIIEWRKRSDEAQKSRETSEKQKYFRENNRDKNQGQ